MGRQRQHDWFNAEITFVTSLKPHSLKEIAKEFEIPYQTVRRYAVQYDWQRKRPHFLCITKYLTRLKIAEKIYGLTVDDILENNIHGATFNDLAHCYCEHLE